MLARVRSLIAALCGRARMESEMDAEMRSHIEAYTDDLLAQGFSREEAARRARMEFGGIDLMKDECREAVGLRWPDELARNVRFAFRVFRKKPAFTAAAVATLALCIGANTAIFSVVDALFFRPLPYPEAGRLAMVGFAIQGQTAEGDLDSFDGQGWLTLRDHSTAIQPAAFGMPGGVNFVSGTRAEYVRAQRVSARYLPVFGVRPLIGRTFTEQEDKPGGPDVAVLSYGFWKKVLGGDPGIIGRAVKLRGSPYTVTGVMPPGFYTESAVDVWTPLRAWAGGEGHGLNYGVIARVRPGFTWEQAQARTAVTGEAIIGQLRKWQAIPKEARARMRLVPLQRAQGQQARTRVLVLWGAVGLVLLIGCMNVAGLLLAHGAERRREMATRIALGGGRAAVVRQLLTESLVLAAMGSALGVLLGYAGIEALRSYVAESAGIWQTIDLNARVLAATGIMALLTSAIFGIVPAFESSRTDVRSVLNEGGGRSVAGSRLWPRRLLVAGQVALGAELLISAGLLLRSFSYLNNLKPGFNPSGVYTAKVSLNDARYRSSAAANRLFDEALARMRRLPGVQYAAAGLGLPYERPLNMGFRRVDGPHPDSANDWHSASMIYVTPEYFQALGIPLLRGRGFSSADGPKSAQVIVVNQAFAKAHLRDMEPVGSHLASGRTLWEIVGMVGDVQQKPDFGDAGMIGPAPAIYMPAAQASDDLLQLVNTWFPVSWAVRAPGQPQGLAEGIARAISDTDWQLPVTAVEPMEQVRSDAIRGHRVQAVLVGMLAALALALAAVGVYGLVANLVAVRTRELGIRLAIGATVRQAVAAAALPGVILAIAGAAVGCGLAAGTTRLLRHLLYGVTAGDPVTIVSAAILLVFVAAAASLLPAWRVTRLNPADTLRHE